MQPSDLCRLYVNNATNASPTWLEIEKCKDLAWPIDVGEADASARDCEWALSEATLLKLEITFGYQYDPGTDAVYDAILTQLTGRTKRQYAFADGDIAVTGTRYLKAFCQIFGMGNNEPLDGGRETDFKLKPCRKTESSALVKPIFVTVA